MLTHKKYFNKINRKFFFKVKYGKAIGLFLHKTLVFFEIPVFNLIPGLNLERTGLGFLNFSI